MSGLPLPFVHVADLQSLALFVAFLRYEVPIDAPRIVVGERRGRPLLVVERGHKSLGGLSRFLARPRELKYDQTLVAAATTKNEASKMRRMRHFSKAQGS